MVAQNVKEGLWKAEQSGGAIQHSQVQQTHNYACMCKHSSTCLLRAVPMSQLQRCYTTTSEMWTPLALMRTATTVSAT